MVTNLHFNTHFLSFLHFYCIPYFLFCLFLFFTLLLPPRLILPCLSFPNFNSLFLVFSSLPFHVFALLLPPPLSFLSFLQFNSICSLISLLFLTLLFPHPPLPFPVLYSHFFLLFFTLLSPCSFLSFLPPLYSLASPPSSSQYLFFILTTLFLLWLLLSLMPHSTPLFHHRQSRLHHMSVFPPMQD